MVVILPATYVLFQFDGGLSTTSNAIHGIMSLAEQQGKAPAITKVRSLLFYDYSVKRSQLRSLLGPAATVHQLPAVS